MFPKMKNLIAKVIILLDQTIHDVIVSMFSFALLIYFKTLSTNEHSSHQKTLISLEETCEIEFSGEF